jgi:hypothetical protein
MMIVPRMAPKGIAGTDPEGEFPDTPLPALRNMGSFDWKAIRERMAFGAQDDNLIVMTECKL